jgi:hypothetical protein
VINVRDPEGRPLAGAEVVVGAASGPHLPAARTDAAGRCELHGVDRENGYTLDVTHPTRPLGGRVAVRPDDPGNARSGGTIEVKVKPCGSLTGRVLDDDGRPMKFAVARVWADIDYPASGRGMLPTTVDVQDNGTFTFDRLIAGVSYSINILADGHATWLGDSARATPGDAQTVGEIRLPWADQQIRGWVVDARGQTITGATAAYERDPPQDKICPPQGCHWVHQTDAYGRFRLSGLPRGRIKLLASASADGHSAERTVHVEALAGARDLRIVLPDVDERLRGIE